MENLTCTRIRHSKFIDRDIVFEIDVDDTFGGERRIEKSVKLRKEFNELGMAFHRNRVELRFNSERVNRDSPEWQKLRESIKESCDTKCEGYWSWKIKRMNDRNSDRILYELDLFFEYKTDMDLWLKEHGLILRLSL